MRMKVDHYADRSLIYSRAPILKPKFLATSAVIMTSAVIIVPTTMAFSGEWPM